MIHRFSRTLFGLTLAAVMTLGLLHATADPAEAGFTCPQTLFGCAYSTTIYDWDSRIACCVYSCPDGSQRIGPSFFF
ncbi:MAG: hypothetical protein AAGC60_08965 [Acidobacteriota bacterium]